MTAFNVTRLTYGDDLLQFGDFYIPTGAGPHPVVILIHGGFWRAAYGLSLMTGLAQDLSATAQLLPPHTYLSASPRCSFTEPETTACP